MVKQTTHGRPPDSDFETSEEDIIGDHVALYKFGRSAETDYPPHEPAPLFLPGHDEPGPREFTNPLRKRRPLRLFTRSRERFGGIGRGNPVRAVLFR
jgi:hypothetical protein